MIARGPEVLRWPGRQWASENRVMEHLSRQRLEAGLSQIRDSPRDGGRIVLLVRRPAVGVRELPGAALLDPRDRAGRGQLARPRQQEHARWIG